MYLYYTQAYHNQLKETEQQRSHEKLSAAVSEELRVKQGTCHSRFSEHP